MSHNPYITQPGNKKSPVAAATYGTTSSATNPAPYGSAGGSSGYASASSTPSGNSYVNGPLTSETTSYPSSSSYGGTTSTSSNAYRSTIAPTLSYGNNDYRSHTSTLASSAAAAGSSNVYGNSPSLSSPTSTSAYTFAAPQSSVLFSKALEVSSPSLERQTKAAAVTALSSAHLSSLRSSSNNRQQEQQYGQENNVLPSMEYPAKNEGTRISLTNSVTYQDGRTTGLISEGSPVKCHKIDYEIKGHDMQLVEIELDPAESVIGEAGAMMFMEDEIKFEAKFGDGAEPKQGFFKKLMAAGGRLMTGESLFITHFTNESQTCKARVAFAAPYPGTIAPVNLANLPGQTITCRKYKSVHRS
uniref:Altered inheritance of mitochondria protein 24, mitochondrial n=1 Tax=Pseudo-nitzschia australis TaxID=44445 RepID=A0A7S4AC84_9STRA